MFADKAVPNDDYGVGKTIAKDEDDDVPRSLFWRHIKALQIKRFHHSKRNKKGILCEVKLLFYKHYANLQNQQTKLLVVYI